MQINPETSAHGAAEGGAQKVINDSEMIESCAQFKGVQRIWNSIVSNDVDRNTCGTRKVVRQDWLMKGPPFGLSDVRQISTKIHWALGYPVHFNVSQHRRHCSVLPAVARGKHESKGDDRRRADEKGTLNCWLLWSTSGIAFNFLQLIYAYECRVGISVHQIQYYTGWFEWRKTIVVFLSFFFFFFYQRITEDWFFSWFVFIERPNFSFRKKIAFLVVFVALIFQLCVISN